MYMTTQKQKGTKPIDEDLDWDQLSDLSFRRRIQNRISQRRHRQSLRRLREGESPTSRNDKPNTKKKNEFVWMQPNTISMNTQQKRQKASTKSTENTRKSGNDDTTFEVSTSTKYQAPLSPESSGSTTKPPPPYRTLNMNGLELIDSINTSHGQSEDPTSGAAVPQQPGLQTLESPYELNNEDASLCPDSSGIAHLLDDSFDMLLMQYQHGNIFQGELSIQDQMSITNTNPFDPQPSGRHCEDARQRHFDASSRMSWDGKGVFGYTALHLAAQRNHLPIVKLLLESGLDAGATNDEGETALHLAARRNHLPIVRHLLESGLDVGATNDEGETALHLAAREGHVSVTQMLLEHHAQVSVHNHKGETVLHAAARGGHLGLVLLLLDYMPDPNMQDFSGQTALHIAVKEGHEEVVRLMIGRGVDVQAKVGLSTPTIAK